ncbi:hypothetical protein AVEN_110513-1 [Araneus ventricosus]|uniref:Uncharacterized protein n=1 Tax=Araneus ventricosus TaxID=182803 RepID=A0A4Y2GWM1_ARAVE|nr:hypothetical protein AVEN_110513-1 [Araneus ventricosus]
MIGSTGEHHEFMDEKPPDKKSGKTTIDDISRRHKLSYEIKIVEIGQGVGDGELCEGFPHTECTEEKTIFDFFRKWRV